MQQQLITLSNGLKTLLINSTGSTMGSVQTWFKAGSALESKDNQGIAHFLEHMFFKGTEKRPGFRIAHDVESFGGEINAFTSFDYTCYYINCPQNKITDSIDILMDMVSNPEFKDEDVIPEIGVVFEEYRRSQDSPSQFAFQKLQQNCFTGNYAHPILGSEKSIKNFHRNQLIEFRKNFYNLSNFLLVVSGDLEQQKHIIEKIESFNLPEGPSSSFPKFKIKNKSTVSVHKKDVSMTQLNIAIQAPSFKDRSAAAEDLAMASLGQGETSLLHQELVMKKTLASAASSSTLFFADGGLHMLRLSFPSENTNEILTELTRVLTTACHKGLAEKSLERIKNQYVASKIYEKESLESYAFGIAHGVIQYQDIDAESNFINDVKKVGFESVRSSLVQIFSRPLQISIQIPNEENSAKVKNGCENFLKQMKKISDLSKVDKKSQIVEEKSKFDKQLSTIELKKGIKLVYRHNPISPSFVFHAYIKGGLRNENSKNNGIHHILSALITKGYKGSTYEKLKQDIENKAASLHGFTGKNAYGLTMHGQAEHFSELIKHFYGSLLYPNFQAKFLKHEKEIAFRNLSYQLKDPTKTCFKRMGEIIFGKHPYALNILGTEKSIKAIKRENITKTHQTNLKKQEIVFTYCGSHPLDEVMTHINNYLSELKARKTTTPKVLVGGAFGHKEAISFDREQTQILITIPSPHLGHKDNSYLKILTTHLSGQSSELFVDVRDRQGLCYTAQPIHFTALESGYWGIYMASGHDKVEAAKNAIYNLLDKIKKNGLSKEEFERVKNMIDGQEQLSIQTNEDYAGIYSVPVLHGFGQDYYYKSNQVIKSMKYESFQSNIKRILKKDWNELVVGR